MSKRMALQDVRQNNFAVPCDCAKEKRVRSPDTLHSVCFKLDSNFNRLWLPSNDFSFFYERKMKDRMRKASRQMALERQQN